MSDAPLEQRLVKISMVSIKPTPTVDRPLADDLNRSMQSVLCPVGSHSGDRPSRTQIPRALGRRSLSHTATCSRAASSFSTLQPLSPTPTTAIDPPWIAVVPTADLGRLRVQAGLGRSTMALPVTAASRSGRTTCSNLADRFASGTGRWARRSHPDRSSGPLVRHATVADRCRPATRREASASG